MSRQIDNAINLYCLSNSLTTRVVSSANIDKLSYSKRLQMTETLLQVSLDPFEAVSLALLLMTEKSSRYFKYNSASIFCE